MKVFNIACKSDSTILITGSTGTGKSSLARKIHDGSKRRNRPFVVVNLATLYEGTLESELFGHERGSFTGADAKRIGRLEMAQGGTVFLDEVGELRPSLQARLLEFLQSRVISPVGSNKEIRLDVRVIAATHKDLAESVRDRGFREDLFHRLRVISVPIKPLKERREDFDQISKRLIEEFCLKEGRSTLRFSSEVGEIFAAYSWPGNIRELRNALEYAVLATEGAVIYPEHLPPWLIDDLKKEIQILGETLGSAALLKSNIDPESKLGAPRATQEEITLSSGGSEFGIVSFHLGFDYAVTCKNFEKLYLQRALLRNGGRINRTARQIGLNKSTLIRRIRSFGLNQDSPLGYDQK
ncbi:MAG: sigma-54 dependent transcriptional regulator [Bdellovibrionia bacterium]